jgi:hypothetical protein
VFIKPLSNLLKKIVTFFGLTGLIQGSIAGTGKRFFLVHKAAYVGSGAKPTLLFLGVKRPGREVGQSSTSGTEVKNQ